MRLYSLSFLLIPLFSFSQNYFWQSNGDTIYHGNQQNIYSSTGRLLYSVQGNSLYNSPEKELSSLAMLTNMSNLQPRRRKFAWLGNQEAYLFTFYKQFVFLAESNALDKQSYMFRLGPQADKIAIIDFNQKVIGFVNKDVTPAFLTAVLYEWSVRYKLIAAMQAKLAEREAQQLSQNGIKGSLQANWGNGPKWIWDGELLRPEYLLNRNLEWSFDGKLIQQKWATNPDQQFEWDGDTFRPVWLNGDQHEISFSNSRFEPVWDTNLERTFVLENGLIKNEWSNIPENEWSLEGEMPIPLIIMVIYGYVY